MSMRIAKAPAGPTLPKPAALATSPRSKTAPRLQGALSPRGPKPVAASLKVEEEQTLVLTMPVKAVAVPTVTETPPPVPAKTQVSETPPPPVPRPLPQPANDTPPPPVPRPSMVPSRILQSSAGEPSAPPQSTSMLAPPAQFPASSRASIAADFRVKELEEAIKGLVSNQAELERSQSDTPPPSRDYSKPVPPVPTASPNNELSAQLKEASQLMKQTAESNDRRAQALEASLNQITQMLREKTLLEEQARVRADRLEDDIRSLRDAHERSLMEEKRKSTAMFSEQSAAAEARLRRDCDVRVKAAEDRAAAAEARAAQEGQRAQELQRQVDSGAAMSAANGSQTEELLAKLRRAEEQARKAGDQVREGEARERALSARLAEAEERAAAAQRVGATAEEKVRLLEIRVRQEEERATKAEERAARAEHAKKEADFVAAKASEEYARRLKDLQNSLPPAASAGTQAGASEATIADITGKWRAAEEKAALYEKKIAAAMQGLKQYKSDKEKFIKTEEDLRKTQEKLKFLEELVGGGPSAVSAPPAASLVMAPTPAPAPAPAAAVFVPPAGVASAAARAQSPAPRVRQDTLDNKLDELFQPTPQRDLRIQPRKGSDLAREAIASPVRKRPEQELALKGNLDTLEAGLAELSKPAAVAPKKGVSSRDLNAQAVNALEAQLDALSAPQPKSTRIPAPATPVQMNKDAMNPAYAAAAERTMSPMRKPPGAVTVKTDDDDFNPRSGGGRDNGGGAPIAVPSKSKSKRDLIQEAASQAANFTYSDKEEDEKIQKLLGIRQIAVAGGKEAAPPDVSTPLKAAANADPPDYDKVVRLLQEGKERPDAAWTNRMRQTMLHMVAIKNQPKLAKWLLDMQAQVDAKDIDGNTPLHICSILGHLECAEVLLRANASVDLSNMNGDTPVHVAAKSGFDNLITAMLPYRPQLDGVDLNGQRVLHKAVYSGSKAVINLLVSNGAHLDPEDENYYTPLLMAELAGKHDIADLLIMLGADTRCCSKQGDSLLWASIEVGNLARAERLVKEHRLDVNLPCGKFRWSALHRAILHLQDNSAAERTVNFLLQLGAKADVKNIEEKTPLFFAAYRGSIGMVRALLSAGANPNALDVGLNSPLHFAKSAEVAALLLDRGAKINHKNRAVHSVLHTAAAFYPNNVELINLLKARGADLKGKNKWGHAPLDLLQIANLEKKIVIPFALNEEALPNDMGGIYIGPPRR